MPIKAPGHPYSYRRKEPQAQSESVWYLTSLSPVSCIPSILPCIIIICKSLLASFFPPLKPVSCPPVQLPLHPLVVVAAFGLWYRSWRDPTPPKFQFCNTHSITRRVFLLPSCLSVHLSYLSLPKSIMMSREREKRRRGREMMWCAQKSAFPLERREVERLYWLWFTCRAYIHTDACLHHTIIIIIILFFIFIPSLLLPFRFLSWLS